MGEKADMYCMKAAEMGLCCKLDLSFTGYSESWPLFSKWESQMDHRTA